MIREALRPAAVLNMDDILIESGSQIVINSIKSLIKIPSSIINHVLYIMNLAKNFNNIRFPCCNRFKNTLVDKMLKEVIILVLLLIFINEISFSENNNNKCKFRSYILEWTYFKNESWARHIFIF